MWDIGCITASVAFFLLAIAYTTACDRLGTKGNS
jgi:precorrin-6B methylase 2